MYSYGVLDSFHFTSFHLIESLPHRCCRKYRPTSVNVSYPISTQIRNRKGREIKRNRVRFFHDSSSLFNNYYRIAAERIIFPSPNKMKFILLISSKNQNINILLVKFKNIKYEINIDKI